MDLLCKAYGAASDDEGDGGGGEDDKKLNLLLPLRPPPKRHRPEPPFRLLQPPPQRPRPRPALRQYLAAAPDEVPKFSAARYVSKRERAILASKSSLVSSPPPTLNPPISPPSSSPAVVGSISDLDLQPEILASLKQRGKFLAEKSLVSSKLSVSLAGHTKAVNSIQWSQSHDHLLASAGMDQTVNVWNVWSKNNRKARVFKHHNAAVKDVRWSPQGFFLLSCGYDSSSRLVDVEKGMEIHKFSEDQIVEVIRFHPINPHLFLSGGSKGLLKLWDIRTGDVVKQYHRGLGPILDVDFSLDGKKFISSTDNSKSRISEDSIIVWDVYRQVPLSNQVYTEAFTCTCVRYHPSDACFVAQSHANYIAIFSSRPPFKLDKYKRYEGHGLWGFPVKCNFSLDGKLIASGSSDGSIYLYDCKSTQLFKTIKAFQQPCIDVAFHPSIPNVIASCSWTGEVSIFG